MSKPEVTVHIVDNPGDGRAGLRLIIDGAIVDTGSFGGEPEDNIECRDYSWVKDMLVTLATRLGANARIERTEVDSWREMNEAMAAAPGSTK